MKNRLIIYLPLLFAIVLIAGIFLGYKLSPIVSHPQLLRMNFERYNKLNDVVSYIENEYVDSVGREEISEEGINGILQNLDPHSQYISADQFHEVNDPLIGNFEGIGIQFRIEKDTIVVVQSIPGGPSEKVGLMAGDRIVMVDDSLIAGIGIDNRGAMRMLKGPRGTEVEVGIFRRGIPDLIDFVITRDIIPTYSIDIAFMPKPGIGYVKLTRFSATTYEEFEEATDRLLKEGMNSLILDLRDNTGGYLQAAEKLADEFLEDGKLIVFTEGYHQPRESAYATKKGKLENIRIVTLINEGSASASEILAGALQDNDRGTIVGRRSFGKGLVQRQLDFPDGSALRLTVARYYTPTGRCIQRPYEKGDGFESYYSESYHRLLNGELEDKDSIQFNDSLKYMTPGGKIVYGGGGIMPDVFVPLQSDARYGYYNKITRKALMFRFAFEYTDKNRKELQIYKDFENFNEHFRITPELFEEFINFVSSNGIERDEEGVEFAGDEMKTMLKAFIARNLFDNEGFYPLYLSIDNVYNKALELLEESGHVFNY
ncbi:MAG: PDZ domain-containing protein [Bacteroidetes bacterium]|nr:PDZ domain-containing protein [Bacteroidota bacterium]